MIFERLRVEDGRVRNTAVNADLWDRMEDVCFAVGDNDFFRYLYFLVI